MLTAQAEEVRALSTKVTADAAEPIKAQMARGVDELRKAVTDGYARSSSRI